MNDIDKIFSKLQNHQVEAPDIWDKIDAQLQSGATTGMESSLGNSLNKAVTSKVSSSVIIKAVTIIGAIGIVGTATYLFVSDDATNSLNPTPISTNHIQAPTSSSTISEQIYTNPVEDHVEIPQNTNQSVKTSSNSKEIEQVFEHNEYEVVEQRLQTIAPSSPNIIKPIESSISNQKTITPQHISPYSNTAEKEKHNSGENILPSIIIPNVFTPNGDGINDYFEIINIEKYPQNNLIIFDRTGNTIARYTGYKNNFNGQNLPAGTYFYKLEYSHLEKVETRVGCVEILRK
jgi:gliding motility-associated-like protein